MNLELPFGEPAPGALDEYLSEIDRALDDLFLDEIGGAFERLRADGTEGAAPPGDAPAPAA